MIKCWDYYAFLCNKLHGKVFRWFIVKTVVYRVAMARNLINCPFCTSFILKHGPCYLVDYALKAVLIKNEKFHHFFFSPLWLEKNCTKTKGWEECKDKIADSSEESSDEPSPLASNVSPFFIQSPIADSCLYRCRTETFSSVIVSLASIR